MVTPRSHWRLLLSPPSSGAENMALDEALMDRARSTGEWVLRVYSWSSPTISFGRNQSAVGRYDLDRIRARGLAVVRRPTGGRAILHHREVTYGVTAPVSAAGDLRESYARINSLLVIALASIGVSTNVAAPERRPASAPGVVPCFAEPSAGELTVDGRKIAGSAQYRVDGALLQHGSILVQDDQSSLADLTLDAGMAIPAPATLEGILHHVPPVSAVAHALFDAVRSTEDTAADVLVLEPEFRARASALVVRYLDDAWTWRR
ncbi:MAG TPA: lipoate--protein ligase family protein [Gemmatimonadaceae bacterium]